MAVFDMCNGPLQETRPQLRLRSLGGQEGTRARVLESRQGKKVTVGIGTMPAGWALLLGGGVLTVLSPSGPLSLRGLRPGRRWRLGHEPVCPWARRRLHQDSRPLRNL